MYIKIFNNDLSSKNFKYEIGKIYNLEGELQYCKNGFYFYDNLNDILEYYSVNSRYYLVEPLGDIIHEFKCYVTNKIKIIRELCLNELLELDNTGKWSFEYLKLNKNLKLEIINKIKDNILKKDKTGEYIYSFTYFVNPIEINDLQNKLVEINSKCIWIYQFALNISNANINLLQNKIINTDKVGNWLFYFSKYIKNSDIKLLLDKIIEVDKTGKWIYQFAINISSISEKDLIYIKYHLENCLI